MVQIQTPGFSPLLLIDACSQGRKGTEDGIKQKCRVARYLYLFVFPVHICKRHTQNCCAYVDLNPHQAIYFFSIYSHAVSLSCLKTPYIFF